MFMFTNDALGPDCWKCTLNVEWHDCSFCPVIQLREGIARRNHTRIKPLPTAAILPHPTRRKNLFKPMKKLSLITRRFQAGFTLVELLTVIAIIGILAAMLLPVLAAAKKSAMKTKARMEIGDLVTAIQAYDQDYGRFPITKPEQTAAGSSDFTTGFSFGAGVGGLYSFDSNSNLVAILMDLEKFPSGAWTTNRGHVFNTKSNKYLNARLSGYNPASTDPNPPGGVDNDGVYRDPWGNPYIITMDTSYDDQCSDYMYCRDAVSGPGGANTNPGLNGLTNPDTTKNNNFQFHGKVMVWSAGPDKKYDATKAANVDVNKDNLLSWQ